MNCDTFSTCGRLPFEKGTNEGLAPSLYPFPRFSFTKPNSTTSQNGKTPVILSFTKEPNTKNYTSSPQFYPKYYLENSKAIDKTS